LNIFNKATERDPRYALAYAGLAEAYLQLPAYSDTTPSAETYLKAKAAATQALQLDNSWLKATSRWPFSTTATSGIGRRQSATIGTR
jgi:hypothetical protein